MIKDIIMERKTARQYLLEKAKADIKIILDRREQITTQNFTKNMISNALAAKDEPKLR